jgi:hypothetical protein
MCSLKDGELRHGSDCPCQTVLGVISSQGRLSQYTRAVVARYPVGYAMS